ncbi:MAG: hypothetical protein H6765_05320 [Candidatus Peribacteria bacterium]|nr:MAG: hypothetical protein H6765_05320 [Candidatus Peribacteria bacterium]
MHDFLTQRLEANDSVMIGYLLRNTLSDNGGVNRGVCTVEHGRLTAIHEHYQLLQQGNLTVDKFGSEVPLDAVVSMNFR